MIYTIYVDTSLLTITISQFVLSIPRSRGEDFSFLQNLINFTFLPQITSPWEVVVEGYEIYNFLSPLLTEIG